jgi:hypothetical protein
MASFDLKQFNPSVARVAAVAQPEISDAFFTATDGTKIFGEHWTTPVPPNAVFSADPWGLHKSDRLFPDECYSVVVDESMPLTQIYQTYQWADRTGQGAGPNDFWHTYKDKGFIRLPKDFIIPENRNNPQNYAVSIFNRDTRETKTGNAAARPRAGSPLFMYPNNGAHAGSGLSNANITSNEIISGYIGHALCLMICHWLHTSRTGQGFVAPADRVDANWNQLTVWNNYRAGLVSGTAGTKILNGVGTTFQTDYTGAQVIAVGAEYYFIDSIPSQTQIITTNNVFKNYSNESHFRDYDTPGYYNGKFPDLKVGSWLAIPPNVTAASLGITNKNALTLFYALKKYGAYIADDTEDIKRLALGVTPEASHLIGFVDNPNDPFTQQTIAAIYATRVVS